MDVAHGLIAHVSTSAADLHSTLEEAAAKVQNIGVLSSLGSTMSKWGWLLVFLVGTAMISRKAAGCMAIGATCAAIASGLPERISNIQFSTTLATPTLIAEGPNLISVLKMIAAAVWFVFLLNGIYHLNKRGLLSRCQGRLRDRLTNIEKEERELD
ncbi:MAG: hypothetical protein M1835_004021, partial [Candelina submexicana]